MTMQWLRRAGDVQQAIRGQHCFQWLGGGNVCVTVEPNHVLASGVLQLALHHPHDGPLHTPPGRLAVLKPGIEPFAAQLWPVEAVAVELRVEPVQVVGEAPKARQLEWILSHEPGQVGLQRTVTTRVRSKYAHRLRPRKPRRRPCSGLVLGPTAAVQEATLASERVWATSIRAEVDVALTAEAVRRLALHHILCKAEGHPQSRHASHGRVSTS
mmetsp:Transcript_70595/g.206635  ORF Transcript_70595/g.206635 Transcript_70595/m.206635 type:complete len:213 (+) Transcript_70595:502-1140(+)